MKPDISLTPYKVRYGANGPAVDAVRLSCESGSHFYTIGLISDGRKYSAVDGRIVETLPATPYANALATAYRSVVFLLSRYLHAGESERRALFWEIKEAIK